MDSSGDRTPRPNARRVNLVVSWTSLLPGDLFDCTNCTGGVAAVAAYARFHAHNEENTLVVPYIDTTSTFVQIHPLGWSLNRLVLHQRFGWTVCLSSPSILTQNSVDYEISPRDISDLQSTAMPLLLTNAGVPPGNSWHSYTRAVHLDATTGLAILSIYNSNSGAALHVDAIAATKGMLNYIHRTNTEAGCGKSESLYLQRVNETRIVNGTCYLPIILYVDTRERFDAFIDAIAYDEHAPALILDLSGHDANYTIPQPIGPTRVWLHSYSLEQEYFHQHVLNVTNGGQTLAGVSLIVEELSQLPTEARDSRYELDMAYLQTLAQEALESDPIVGTSGFMPLHRQDTYRRCNGGECELGNLFADALRWRTGADVSFISSGGLRGEGWPAGNVSVSDIWRGLPFPNTICTGNFTGVSLFTMLDYSIGRATFRPEVSDDGGLLLQVSGLRITYNPNLEVHRLVAIEVYDVSNDTFIPLERLRMYSFATDSYVCGGNDIFPELLGSRLQFEGEDRGVIGTDLHQDTVAEFLSELDGPFNTSLQGRFVNTTNVTIPLNLVQTADSCLPGTYYSDTSFSCEGCPVREDVRFLSEQVEFEGVAGSDSTQSNSIDLVNTELFEVTVSPKAFPQWVELLDETSTSIAIGQQIDLLSGQQISVQVQTRPQTLEPGTALATVSFAVSSRGSFPGCAGQDASFDIFMRVIPTEKLNQLGLVRILGWILACIVVATASFCCAWVVRHRDLRIVKTMQPIFLVVICVGVCIMGLSIIPLSIDDEIASENGSDMACMAIPWLFSMGFTLSQSALFSKLWRINKLFNAPQIRRMQVHEKDVIGPFLVLFTLNFSVLLVATLVDPLQFERVPMVGEEWNTYGRCTTNGTAGNVLLSLNVLINVSALVIACYQAYLARNVSDEFSEGVKLGIVMFSWAQLMIVGIPVMFLIDADNPVARYFIMVSLCFAVCESLLLFIFVPMFLHLRQSKRSPRASTAVFRSNISADSSQAIGRTRISGIDLGSTTLRSNGHDSQFESTSEHAADLVPKRHLAVVEEVDEEDLLQSARALAASISQFKPTMEDIDENKSVEESDDRNGSENGRIDPSTTAED